MLICSSIRTRLHWTTFADGLRNQDAKTATRMPKQEVISSLWCQIVTRLRLEISERESSGGGLTWQVKWRGIDLPIQLTVLCTVLYCIWVFNLQLCHCSMCSQRQVWKPGRIQNVYTQETGHNQTLGTILESSCRYWVKKSSNLLQSWIPTNELTSMCSFVGETVPSRNPELEPLGNERTMCVPFFRKTKHCLRKTHNI